MRDCLRLWIAITFLTVMQTVASPVYGDYLATLEQLKTIQFTEPLVGQAVDEFQKKLNSITPRLPDDFKAEFETAVDRRLQSLLKEDENHITTEYKELLLGTRLAQFAQAIADLPVDNLPSAADRSLAREQVRQFLERLSAPQGVNEDVLNMATATPRGTLEPYLWDVFRPGYGQPFSQADTEKIEEVLEKVVTETQRISAELGGEKLPPQQFRHAAGIGTQSEQSLKQVFRGKSIKAAPSLFSLLRGSSSPLLGELDEKLQRAEQEEFSAIAKRSEENAAAMIRENNPHAVAARMQAAKTQVVEEARSELASPELTEPVHAVQESVVQKSAVPAGTSKFSFWKLLAINLVGICVIAFVYRIAKLNRASSQQ